MFGTQKSRALDKHHPIVTAEITTEDFSILEFGADVIAGEAATLSLVAARLGESFERAVRMIADCRGALFTCGIGKAGHVAKKLSASFASTGTPSHFLNPADALHGDLGSIRNTDLVLILSYSGESDEIVRLVGSLRTLDAGVIAMTSTISSRLARCSDVVLEMGQIQEACPLGLAPTSSTTAMMAMGDALFLSVMRMRNFTAGDFAIYHPAGQLGRKLMKVHQAMSFRAGENLSVLSDRLTVGQLLHEASSAASSTRRTSKRRSGAVVLVGDDGKISGIFTDGDLRRLITDDDGSALRTPVHDVMTANPKRINAQTLASEAFAIMRPFRIDDLPVVDDDDRPVGLIDIQDLVALRMPEPEPQL